MKVSKCIYCEHHDVNTKTTFCTINHEPTCTDNNIPCPVRLAGILESHKKEKEEQK